MATAGIYTAADRAAVKAAIVRLATGEQVTAVTIAGRTIQYAAADMSELKRLRAEIDEDLAQQAGTRRSRSRIAVTRKGL